MSKSSMLKEGMKGGLNGLLSSTKKPTKEQITAETTPVPPVSVSVSETTEVPVHCNFLINKSIHTRMKYLAIKKGMSLRDIVNEAMTEYLKRHDT
ncbi:MAG: plasmid partition protein ParG [Prevotella sp.]